MPPRDGGDSVDEDGRVPLHQEQGYAGDGVANFLSRAKTHCAINYAFEKAATEVTLVPGGARAFKQTSSQPSFSLELRSNHVNTFHFER